MIHVASSRFWRAYQSLPTPARELADRAYAQLRQDSTHPSLQFKRIGAHWSVRVGLHYRALGIPLDDGVLWFWIGSHAEYDSLIRR